MKNNHYLNILNFIHELVFLENRINLEPKDLKVCIKNISDAHLVITNKIAGENRAKACVKEAISDDYFKNKSLKKFDNIVLNIIGGDDIKLYEIDEVAANIKKHFKEDVNMIVANTIDNDLSNHMLIKMLVTQYK